MRRVLTFLILVDLFFCACNPDPHYMIAETLRFIKNSENITYNADVVWCFDDSLTKESIKKITYQNDLKDTFVGGKFYIESKTEDLNLKTTNIEISIYNSEEYIYAPYNLGIATVFDLKKFPRKFDLVKKSIEHEIPGLYQLLSNLNITDHLTLISIDDTIIQSENCYKLIINSEENGIHGIEINHTIALSMETGFPIYWKILKDRELKEIRFDNYKIESELDERLFKRSILPELLVVTEHSPWTYSDTLLHEINGEILQIRNLIGKVVLIDFSMIACKACKNAIPTVNFLNNKYDRKNVEVFAVYPYESQEQLRAYAKEQIIEYRIFYNADRFKKECRVSAFPTFYLFDQEGYIAYSHIGFSSDYKDILISKIDSLLN